MPVTLGAITFDADTTTVRERLEEVGGRDERRITVSGLVLGSSTVADIEARLDEILDAASVVDYSAELSVRAGRRLLVRRNDFRREIRVDELVGAFTLELASQDVFEEATSETSTPWTIAASGASILLSSAGNAESPAVITLTASGTVVEPSVIADGQSLAYPGTIANGSVLVFDGVNRRVTVDGTDVTPYTKGEFPAISPEGTTLLYIDDATSSHVLSGTVAFRDRWW